MSRRRRQQNDAEINSDSFLDIIANIVGILIILIVVAGLRVSQMPVFQKTLSEAVTEDDLESLGPETDFEVPEYVTGTTDAEAWDPNIPEPESPEPADPVVIDLTAEPDPALRERHRRQTDERDKLQAQLASLKTRLSDAEENVATQESLLNSASQQLETLNQKLLSARQSYNTEKARVRLQSDSRQQHDETVQRLRSLVSEAERKKADLETAQEPVAEVLRHDMTPVSKLTEGDEIHFMVLNDRVAEVPIELLSKQLEHKIKSRRDWLLRSNQHMGEVGPIRGFRMQYVVQKQEMTALDQLRNGSNMVRIAVTRYVIIPDEDSLLMESYSQATGSTSRFLIAVRSAAPGTTCTFWVYPESFDTYQKLKKLAHDSNLRVAGRPLPEGMPISGSPTGSRSAAQ